MFLCAPSALAPGEDSRGECSQLKSASLFATVLWNLWMQAALAFRAWCFGGLSLFFFLATPCGLWDFSSLTRDQTRALGSESVES